MKLGWLRLIISAMVVFAALSGAASSLAAPSAHDCVSMSMMNDCPYHGGDHSTAPRHCDSLVCGALQLTPPEAQKSMILTAVGPVLPIVDDAAHLGLSAPPDLRPPIL